MNNDLISRSTLKKEIASLVVNGESRIYEVMPRDGGEWIDGIASAYREIDNAPTIDAISNEEGYEMYNKGYMSGYERGKEGRPKGEWIEHYDNSDGFTWPTCSRCMFKAYEDDYNFCPNCGADMRGGKT